MATAEIETEPVIDRAAVLRGDPDPHEVEGYREVFDVSTGIAESRLTLQRRGALMAPDLEAAQRKLYAGVWFDNDSGEFVVPLLPAADQDSVEATFASADLENHYRIDRVQYSWEELEDAQERLDKTLLPLIEEGLLTTSLDPRTNAVVIHQAEGVDKGDRGSIDRLIEDEGGRAEVRPVAVQRFEPVLVACNTAIRVCDKPLRGGVFIEPSGPLIEPTCTAGFKAIGNAFGNRFMLTAGHCYQASADWNSRDAGNVNHYVGHIEAGAFPGSDYAAIRVNGYGDWWEEGTPWPSVVVYWGGSQNLPISTESSSYIGEAVCHSGWKSGSSCGVVTAIDKTQTYTGGHTVHHLTEVSGGSFCAEPGDSGGPVWAGSTALGIFSGALEVPCGGHLGYYIEVTEATNALGVSVGTPVGAPPYAETSPANPVQGREATGNGKVDPNGLPTTYRFDYGATTSYGSSTQSWSAGAGWGAGPVSGTISNLQPLTTYHYRLVASNSAGTSYGADAQFTTTAAPPLATTEPVTGKGTKGATLQGKVNPQGADTYYHFEYGLTTSYGTKVPAAPSYVGSAVKDFAKSAVLSGLHPETTYHYRIVASNSKGVTYGSDRAFTTLGIAPTLKLTFGSPGSGNGQLNEQVGVAVDANGDIWVADTGNDRIQEFNAKGEYLSQFGTQGSGNGQLNEPKGLAFTPGGDLWVADSGNYRLQKFDVKGKYLAQFGSEGIAHGQFVEPYGVAIGADGYIWVSDARYRRVEKFTPTGGFVLSVGETGNGGNGATEFLYPRGLAIDAKGDVWVADSQHHQVQEISPGGALLTKFGAEGSGKGQFQYPYGIAVRPSGNLLVLDRDNARVQELSPSGEFLAQFGTLGSGSGQLWYPQGIAVGPGGTEYVADTGNSRVQKWHQPWDPEAVTEAASAVKGAEATLNGAVNPSGVATTYQFEYGLTTSYGTKAPAVGESAGSGTDLVAKSQTIAGLKTETTYHFRIVATSSEGTTYGKDVVFTTTPADSARLGAMAVTEPFNGGKTPVSDFAADWAALGWASGSPAKGENTASGWRPVSVYPTVNGAFYASTLTDVGPGVAAVATLAANPANASRYFSLWLDMPSPSSSRAGYELRFTLVAANTYNVVLSRWVGGVQTTLALQDGYAFANGSSFALVDKGGTVSAWTDTGAGFTQLLAASDASFGSGSAGVEGSGNITRLVDFKLGLLLTPVTGMDAALNDLAVVDSFAGNENPLSGGGSWAALSWDNSISGHNTGWVSSGWGPYDAFATVNGAFWQKTTFADTGAGDAVGALLAGNPTIANRYFSVWLNMPSPASARTGYELRFTETSSGIYDVSLAKWQAGSKVTLAATTGYSFPVGARLRLVDKGGTVSAWTKTGSEYAQLLSAADSAFKSGYAGIEGSGNILRLKDFAAGPLPPS